MAGATGLGLLTTLGCSEEISKIVPELEISNNGLVTPITEVDKLVGKDIGLSKIFFYAKDDFSQVAVFLDRAKNTQLTYKTIDFQTFPFKDGFVPFDPAFNLPRALAHLNRQYQIEKPVLSNPTEQSILNRITAELSENDPGISLVYKTPPVNTDYMYVFDSRGFFTVNGKEPTTSILQTKFRFTKQLSGPSPL